MINYFLIIILIVLTKPSFSQEFDIMIKQNSNLKDVLNKDKITIVITDSGLGGLSVCAGIEDKLRTNKSFREVNLIFFNALPEKGTGYNSMPNIEVKAQVFSEALKSMEKKFHPDLILIACNTLSVVYPHTEFSKVSSTKVLGIVDFGVQMILSELSKNKNCDVIILGTQTTINSESHKNKLLENGIDESKIIGQACPNLESEIQGSPESETVKGMVELYVSEAAEKLNNTNEPVIAALCCTHYGFAEDIFKSSLKNMTDREVRLLNPNDLMVNSIVLEENNNKFAQTEINVKVVSRALIDDDEKKSIGGLIHSYAPLTSKALNEYYYDPNLFFFINQPKK